MSEPQTITIRLSFGERSFLAMIAQRGGEITFNRNLCTPDVLRRIDGLIGKGCMTEMPMIGSKRVVFKLTDIGRNLVTLILKGAPSTRTGPAEGGRG